ncbi:AEC family transporter [Falsirhodobacter xinxiangensis]|uniref:AEC family transporter n=1 Tax=Falsirhodobacter xinxiangensis TaxID=2530049 RepID=UPI0010AB371A|nr:AEC family transporter [Rhodobacter xinxiangensis]
MLAIFLKTLPFFAIIALGFAAGRARFLGEGGGAVLNRFVFWFALPALLFGFAVDLPLGQIFSARMVVAYVVATGGLYTLVFAISRLRGCRTDEATVEAQCATIGNLGFLGIPMLVALLGAQAAGPVLLILTVDIVLFGSLFTLIIASQRGGGQGAGRTLLRGLAGNPMVMSILAGMAWSAGGLPIPAPLHDLLSILGAAATPGALFAIGISLAAGSAARWQVAGWLSFCKLALHPAAVAAACLMLSVDPFAASVMIAAASLPVAGNVFMMAEAYGVAPQRVSAAILLSTTASVLTVTAVIGAVTG